MNGFNLDNIEKEILKQVEDSLPKKVRIWCWKWNAMFGVPPECYKGKEIFTRLNCLNCEEALEKCQEYLKKEMQK